MLRVSRTTSVAILATLTLLLVGGSWFHTGWQSSKLEAAALRQRPAELARQELGDLAMELTNRLDALRSKENGRPYYHYQNLFHDPRGLSAGKSVSPSPLVETSADPLIGVHYQIDSKGHLSIPPVNEELAQLSHQPSLAANTERLAQLRRAQPTLSETPIYLALAQMPRAPEPTDSPEEEQVQAPVQQATFRQEVFAQNVAPNQVFSEIASERATKKSRASPSAALDAEVEVATHGFRWRAADIDDQAKLIAVRRIETPEGNLTQGFVIDNQAVAKWLDERAAPGSQIQFVHEATNAGTHVAQPVPALNNWSLVTDISAPQTLASARADKHLRQFLWRFAPAAFLGLLLMLAVVAIVSRAERLAVERSEFAAAAAHELRTPLAGLQLYGDMLAEGLGNQETKDKYARFISDEAQRLGRVVSNVLDFSQMEKNGVTVEPKSGNLAECLRQVSGRVRRQLEDAGMEVRVQAPATLDALFDEDAVARILQNLMDNAEKYSRDQPTRKLELVAETDASGARITVSDSGTGVGRAMRGHIFKPFRRNAGKDGPAGLGLGLSLARALARQQGGDLFLQDSPMGGAAFVLQLPRPG